jgi:hypothetical protein
MSVCVGGCVGVCVCVCVTYLLCVCVCACVLPKHRARDGDTFRRDGGRHVGTYTLPAEGVRARVGACVCVCVCVCVDEMEEKKSFRLICNICV